MNYDGFMGSKLTNYEEKKSIPYIVTIWSHIQVEKYHMHINSLYDMRDDIDQTELTIKLTSLYDMRDDVDQTVKN
jgi:hypothetical protein